MAILEVSPFSPGGALITGAEGSNTMDANGEKAAFTFINPEAKTIDRLCARFANVSGTLTATFRLETVDTSGFPTGTLADTDTEGTVSVTGNGWYEVTLTAGYAATVGEVLALVIVRPDGAENFRHVWNNSAVLWAPTPPASLLYTTAWSANGSRYPVGAIRYSDATYPRLINWVPSESIDNGTNLATSTTPDERGNLLTVPYPCRLAGAVWVVSAWAAGDDFDVVAYDSGGSVIASQSVNQGLNASSPSSMCMFPTPVDLDTGDTIRLVVKPTTTNALRLWWHVWNSAAVDSRPMAAWDPQHTYRTDAGSWTDVSTQSAHIAPVLTGVDDGTSSGGGEVAYGFVG